MIVISDGFDTYNASQLGRRYPSFNGAGAYAMVTPGYSGIGQALQLENAVLQLSLPSPLSALFFGVQFKYTNDDTRNFIILYAASGAVLQLGFGLNQVSINGTSYEYPLAAGKFYNLVVQFVVGASTGVIAVKIDGNIIANLISINTGTSPVTALELDTSELTNTIDNLWIFDDTGAHSNTWPTGAIIITPQPPNVDGAPQDWSLSAGASGFALVEDAIADDDATYIFSNTPGQVSNFGIVPVSMSGIAQIHGVQVSAVYRKDDINPLVMHIAATSGASEVEGPDLAVPMDYVSASLVLGNDPSTGDQWTAAGVNAMLIGVKEIS